MTLLSIMRQVEIFRGMNEEQLSRVGRLGQKTVLNRGDVICRQGDPGDNVYIIGQGQVEIVVRDSQGASRPALYLGSGQVVGEVALIDEGPRSATVIAAEDNTTVYSITIDAFTRLCREDTAIGYLLMRNLAQDLSFKLRRGNVAKPGS